MNSAFVRIFWELAFWKIRIEMSSVYEEIRSKSFIKKTDSFLNSLFQFREIHQFLNFKYWTFMSTWILHLRDIKNVNACDPQYAKSRIKRQPKVVSEPSCSVIIGDPSGVEPSFQKLCKKSILNPIFQFFYYQIPIFR